MTQDMSGHCIDLLRKADPDHYLACLWLREDWRKPIAALYAFNAEIDRVPLLVNEPVAGEIRLQWWREVIEGKRETGGNPVADALLEAISAHDLPVSTFANYLEARIFDLYHDSMPDRSSLEGYAGETASALLMLAAQCAGFSQNSGLADACGHGGVARTIAGVLRSMGLQRHQRRCYMPGDLLAEARLNTETWLDESPDERHLRATGALIDMGREHLAKASAAISRLPAEARPVFMPLAPIGAYLSRAGKAGAGLFEHPVDLSPLGRQWLFARAALTGRV